MTDQERIAQLEAQLAAMKAQAQRKLTLKVTDGGKDGTGSKGAISLYGLGRFPITLYRGQWERLVAEGPHITQFIEANAGLLSVKA